MIRITLQYFDGCPNWEQTDRILTNLLAEGWDATVDYELIDSYDQAMERGFIGSPTLLVNGADPFGDKDSLPGLSCRIYQTDAGPAGSPTIHQVRQAIAKAAGTSHRDQR